jgi:hypothetical protein
MVNAWGAGINRSAPKLCSNLLICVPILSKTLSKFLTSFLRVPGDDLDTSDQRRALAPKILRGV